MSQDDAQVQIEVSPQAMSMALDQLSAVHAATLKELIVYRAVALEQQQVINELRSKIGEPDEGDPGQSTP